MASISFTINGTRATVDAEPATPALWVIRDHLGLTGTKYGCGKAVCGACTIHLDGNPVRACALPVSALAGKRVTTIEGLSAAGDHPLQRAWIAAQAPQCGYCQPGQLMQAAALLEENPQPTRTEIMTHMQGNLCRCGAYLRIRQAIESVAQNNTL
jgi:isoquinoline 1-oxidoreductase alpha subunit